jgi:hypothetical protein
VTRLLVAAVCVLAAAAAGDALRGSGAGERAASAVQDADGPRAIRLAASGSPEYVAEGSFLHKRVLRAGREHLSADRVADAFPAAGDEPVHVANVVLAPDGTLVLAVQRFPIARPVRSALEFWRGRRLVAAFEVPPGSLAGGVAFSEDGRLVATFAHDGRLRGVFDRRGRRLPSLPDSFFG